MSLGLLSYLSPSIPWKEYLNTFLLGVTKVDENEVVFANDVIVGIGTLLKKTPARVLANYLVWRVIQESVHLTLNERLRNNQHTFYSVLYDLPKNSPVPRLVVHSIFNFFYKY